MKKIIFTILLAIFTSSINFSNVSLSYAAVTNITHIRQCQQEVILYVKTKSGL